MKVVYLSNIVIAKSKRFRYFCHRELTLKIKTCIDFQWKICVIDVYENLEDYNSKIHQGTKICSSLECET